MQRSRHRLFCRPVDDEDRHVAVVQHVVAHTAQDGASQRAASTRTHDDQLSSDVIDDVNDDATWYQASFCSGADVRQRYLEQNRRTD